ncbi:hypothetical protein H0H81_006495 [Sphagnurus paluster]|uniref:Velvet domain-containing protein n=1 Tax=Sphagnurus paluster TaxID=117069 RepID=A0A9P7GRA7_9AGAR|nr:hypothetical protein H0H81_006495 [Sphagnurus paluster]
MKRQQNELSKHLYNVLASAPILAASGQSSPRLSVSSGESLPESSSAGSSQSATGTSTPPMQLIRRQPRIQISSLLATPSTRSYRLEVVQHPQKTAEFGQSNLSRLPLTPPIIARLTVQDSSGNPIVPEAELPFLIAHLSLFSDDGMTALDMGSTIGTDRTPPLLYGNLVSSIDQLEDLQGNLGLFFVFPDVSIRWRGRFQIGITVVRISRSDPSGGMGVADEGVVLAEARTQSFDVVPHDQYTAVRR